MRAVWLALVFGLVGGLFAAPFAMAQDVTLSARGGGLTVEGTLLSFDGAFYRVETRFGALTVDAEGVVCAGPGCPDLTAPFAAVRIAAADGLAQGLLPALVAAFAGARGYPLSTEGDTITLRDATDTRDLAAFSIVAVDDGAAAGAVVDELADAALGAGTAPGLGTQVLAVDAIVAITAPDNPVERITTRDLARVLTGEITTWDALGGPAFPIVLHGLAPGADIQRAMAARLGREIAAGVRHGDAAALAAAVARDPFALALTVGAAIGPARAMVLTDSCGFVLDPRPRALKAGDYPLTLSLMALTPPRRLPLILREFLDFAGSTEAQEVLAGAGLVSRAPELVPLLADDGRLSGAIRGAAGETALADLQTLARAMEGGTRLTFTFRADGETGSLDALSRQHAVDLASYLQAGLFDGQRLMLAGFAGDAAASQEAAEQVAAALAEAAPDATVDITPSGFGASLPIACDTTAIGRQLNRRVEVWMFPATDTPPL
jgi:phosphate transport system substrate-binding protein